MPIPATPVRTEFERFDDAGNVIDVVPMIHIPCPTHHVGHHVIDRVETEFDVAVAEYSADDGGHVAIGVHDEADLDGVLKLAESTRDRIRQEHGVAPYDPTADTDALSQFIRDRLATGEATRPRYIY